MAKQFFKEVDLRNKKEMIDFLANHFRYHTLNSWNNSTSYANNVKIYNLGLTKEQEDKFYEMRNSDEDFYSMFEYPLFDFEREHHYKWQIAFNGRDGGYLVLYQGNQEDSGYKSYCTECGQKNYKTVEESGNNVCGKCGAHARVNFDQPNMRIVTYSGRSTDMGEDFEDWTIDELRKRVKLVQEFDKACDDTLMALIDILDSCEIKEEVITVTTKVKKIVNREE